MPRPAYTGAVYLAGGGMTVMGQHFSSSAAQRSCVDPAPRRAGLLVLVLLSLGSVGCTDMGEVTVLNVDIDTFVPGAASLPARASLEVFDVREEAELERTALGTSMGGVEFDRPAVEIVRQLVQASADRLLERQAAPGEAVKILCGIRAFDVRTPSTPLYWDMTAEFELVLRIGDEDRTAAGTATDRTFVWPTQKRLQAVTDEAFGELAGNVDKALAELLALAHSESP